jgi:hypothetical protein
VGVVVALLSALVFVAAPTLASATTTSGPYIALSVPTRICDTRTATMSGTADQCTGKTLGAQNTFTVQVTGEGGVPSTGVSAVVANVTVTDTTSAGFLTVWPTGESQPLASSLNWVAGGTVANLVTVPVNSSGQISLYNYSGATDVIIDVDGYIASTASGTAGLSEPLPPARICDTRPSSDSGITDQCTGKTLGAASTLTVQVTGEGGVPSTGVSAIEANVTVTDTTSAGFLTIWPAGQSQPLASSLNWTAGANVANLVTVPVNSSGQISIYNSSGATDVIVDVEDWFTDGSNPDASGGSVTPLTPSRVCDTRASAVSGLTDQCTGSTLGAASTLTVRVTGEGGVPSTGVSAVIAHVTVTDTSTAGFLTVWPTGQSQPLASNLNWNAPATIGNLVTVPVGSSGQISIYNSSGNTDVIVDLVGYVTSSGGTAAGAGGSAGAGSSSGSGAGTGSGSGSGSGTGTGSETGGGGDLTWSAPTFVGTVLNAGFESISCASATYCLATLTQGSFATWNGSSWSSLQTIPPPPSNPGFWSSSWSMLVSCTSIDFCVVAAGPNVFMWNGSTWSDEILDSDYYSITSVSCVSTAFCMAVDALGNEFTWNGSTWGARLDVDSANSLDSVSCPSTSFCAAVDQEGNALTFNGSTWSAPESIDPGVLIDSLSCVSATFCMAGDYEGNTLDWNGSSWSARQFIDPGTSDNNQNYDTHSISCATTTLCVAVGTDQTVTWIGSAWLDPTMIDPSGWLASVSCPSTTFCMAVDAEGNAFVGQV